MTVTVRLNEAMEAKVRRLLEQKGGSVSDFIRAAIAEKLEREAAKPTPYELGRHLFGRHGSGRSDLASNSEQILREMFRARRRR
jgi:Arc/MetJ-type ribon-helix-helix transcriptional regulator